MKRIQHVAVILLSSCLILLTVQTGQGSPGAYPPDLNSNIPWSAGTAGVTDIQAAFNNARTGENSQLGTSLPMLTLPSQAEWDTYSDTQKALWLINRERIDRGVQALHSGETNVTSVAQYYSDYLQEHNVFSHNADGRSPWERLADNPAIGACYDFLNVAENLYAAWGSGSFATELPIERAIYAWMYYDAGSSWGHRHAILWYPYNDNSGEGGKEGFLGMGRTLGPFMGSDYGVVVVMNIFDPCASWSYAATYHITGVVTENGLTPMENVRISESNGLAAYTNASGIYTFSDMLAGSFTITAEKEGTNFTPVSHTISLPPSATGMNFNSGSGAGYSISGTILDEQSIPLAGVTVSGGVGISTVTGADGTYTLSGLAADEYLVTPTRAGYTFTPAWRMVTVPPDATAQDFVGAGPSQNTESYYLPFVIKWGNY